MSISSRTANAHKWALNCAKSAHCCVFMCGTLVNICAKHARWLAKFSILWYLDLINTLYYTIIEEVINSIRSSFLCENMNMHRK